MSAAVKFILFSITIGIYFLKEIKSLNDDTFSNDFSKSSCDFTLNLLKVVEPDDNDNVLLSPTSIGILLAILQQGSNGETLKQLENVLQMNSNHSKHGYGHAIKSLERETTNLTIEWGNRGYVAPGFQLNSNFLNTVQENFNMTVEELDLTTSTTGDAATKINNWVKQVTHDNIKNFIDASFLTPDFVMILVNAIYFKSVWDSPFQKYKTRTDKFQINDEQKVEVPFMRQAGRFTAGEDTNLGIKWIELPFQDDNFSMIFILPIKSHGLKQVMEKLSGTDLKRIIDNKGTRRVKLTIPKFKLTKKEYPTVRKLFN
ncbi:serine proteinase inhibitor, putative [Pediculus humanus corporis]|uniref:Serine proteinase inhibitor, putative n=1 Tax=Pediculus humanus subsp. corporis TaxID=121224 RepID=E0VD84_PEDHC|nr:serine proteinase inhibitor, putative [Pediculus humanus corporis]EEB11340.1 serine proteinase inhibitor, putative [Pediculus humanus corporis]